MDKKPARTIVEKTLFWTIASVTHEANRRLCESFGDNSQATWVSAPAWQRQSSYAGVSKHWASLEDTGHGLDPEKSHEAWLSDKDDAGWQYGAEKSEDLRTHPSMRPYDELPVEERLKDYVFGAIVGAFYRGQT